MSSSPSSPAIDINSSDAEAPSKASVAANPSDGWSPDETNQGTVSPRTYAAYVSAAGGVVTALAVLVVSVVSERTRGFSVWWLAYWIEQGSGNANVSLL